MNIKNVGNTSILPAIFEDKQNHPGAKPTYVSSVGKPPLVECTSKTRTKSQSTGVLYI
jgi:hypothetical protein